MDPLNSWFFHVTFSKLFFCATGTSAVSCLTPLSPRRAMRKINVPRADRMGLCAAGGSLDYFLLMCLVVPPVGHSLFITSRYIRYHPHFVHHHKPKRWLIIGVNNQLIMGHHQTHVARDRRNRSFGMLTSVYPVRVVIVQSLVWRVPTIPGSHQVLRWAMGLTIPG